MKILVLALLAFALMLGGCSSKNDKAINSKHDAMLGIHATQAQKAVTSQSNAIRDVSKFVCTEAMSVSECVLGKAFVAMAAGREIAAIKFQEFTGNRPTTGVDVQIVVAKEVGKGLPIAGMTITSVAAIEADKGSVVNNADNGSTVNNTLDEDHTTNFGDESTVTSMPDNSTVAEEETEE